MKTALEWEGGSATPEVALGTLSLIVWTLIITTSIKYVAVVMRADNEGEGGILALMSLLGVKRGTRVAVIAAGILGAALLYGDGAITPAISVLSALEGLTDRGARDRAVDRHAGGRHPGRAVRPAAAGQRAHRQAVRPDHDALVRHHRGARARSAWSAIPACSRRSTRATAPRSCSRTASPASWCSAPSSCARPAPRRSTPTWGISARARSGSRGTAWCCRRWLLNYAGQTAIVLERPLPAGANPFYELCPGVAAAAARRAGDARHHHREPGDHQRRLLDDAPGDPARPVPAPAHQADLGRGLRPDLCRLRQLEPDGAHAGAHAARSAPPTTWRRPTASRCRSPCC